MGGEDLRRLEGNRSRQEQEGQDREQEDECSFQEEVCQHCWALDAGCQEGTRGPEDQGLCRDQEGLSTLRQGEGALRKVRLPREVCDSRTHVGASSRCGAFYTCCAHGPSYSAQCCHWQ